MKIGLFGGSFDPVHYGHMLLAETVLESLNLDEILFMPAAKSPHKSNPPVAKDRARLEMLQLAIADHPNFRISDLEIRRKGDSYTVDTLEELRKEQPKAEWSLLIGADSLVDFPNWKDPARILEMADLAVMDRPGDNGQSGIADDDWKALSSLTDEASIQRYRANAVMTTRFDFSSTDIRQRVQEKRSIRYRTSRAVERYVVTQKLYQSS